MKRLSFVLFVCMLFSLLAFTNAWSLLGDFPQGDTSLELAPMESNLQGNAGDASGFSNVGATEGKSENTQQKGINLPADSSTLLELDNIEFDEPELADVAIDTIKSYCEENDIALEKAVSVVKNFDSILGINASGGMIRGISLPENDKPKPLIKISSDTDAEKFGNLMGQITAELVQRDKKGGLPVFDGNELTGLNLTIQGYTNPIGEIAYKNPDVKGTNILLGALDFYLNFEGLDNIKGKGGYEMWNGDDGLLIALSKYSDDKTDWVDVLDPRSGYVGYQRILDAIDNTLKKFDTTATVKNSKEMDAFADMINVAQEAFTNPANDFNMYKAEYFWNVVLQGALKESEETRFGTVTEYIRQNYKI